MKFSIPFRTLPFLLLLGGGFSLFAGEVTVMGYLEPIRGIDMDFSEDGVVKAIHVREGDTVKKGQPILQLETDVLEAKLEIARMQAESEAAIEVAKVEVSISSDRYEKLTRLKGSGTAHAYEVARALADGQKADSQFVIATEEKKIAGLRVKEIEAQIATKILKSPIDGVVTEINRDVAESVRGSRGGDGKPIVRVSRIDQLKLVVPVPSAFSSQLVVGAEKSVRVLDPSSLNAEKDSEGGVVPAVIEFVSPEIDPASETIRTELIIENGDGKLRSGSRALLVLDS